MQVHEHILKSTHLGTQRTLTSFHFGPSDAPKVYIQASLHADEIPGMLCAWQLKQAFKQLEAQQLLKAHITLVPQANPIGHAQYTLGNLLGRFELNSGQNFNRHYPSFAHAVFEQVHARLGDDREQNTTLILQAMQEVLKQQTPRNELEDLRLHLMGLAFDAEIVLDLHCDFDAAMHIYTGTPLWPKLEPLARLLGSHAQFLALESGDYPFDEACSQTWWILQDLCAQQNIQAHIPLHCHAATIELKGMRNVSMQESEQDATAIIEYLRYLGLIAGEPCALPELIYPATDLAGSENINAPHPGIVSFNIQAGDMVEVGQCIATIIDPVSDQVSELSSLYGGMVYALECRHYALAGQWVAKVATQTAFKTGKLLSL